MGVITYRLEGEEGRAVQAFLKLTDAQRKAELASMRLGAASQRTSQQARQGASAAAGSFRSWATSLVSVTAGVAILTKALHDMNAERVRAAELTKEAMPTRAKLLQLAGGEPSEMRRLLAETLKSRREAGLTAAEAEDLQFSLESMGEARERAFFAGFKHITEPVALATGAAKIKGAFGVAETGPTREVVNKLLAASAISETTVERFGPVISAAAEMVQEIAGRDEELLGTFAQLTKGKPSPEVTITQIRSLSKVIALKDLGGKGLLAGVAAIRDEIEKLPAPERMKYFGRVEAFMGYKSIVNQWDAIQAAIEKVTAAAPVGPEDLSRRTQRLITMDPKMAAARQAAIDEQKMLIEQEEAFAETELKQQAIISGEMERGHKRRESPFAQWMRRKQMEHLKFFGADEDKLRRQSIGISEMFKLGGNAWQWIKDQSITAQMMREPGPQDSADARRTRAVGEWIRDNSLLIQGLREPTPADTAQARRTQAVLDPFPDLVQRVFQRIEERIRASAGADTMPVPTSQPAFANESVAPSGGRTVIHNHYGDVYGFERKLDQLPADAPVVEVP